MRRTLLLVALALMIAGLSPPTAGATFPGRNGPIAYRPVDPETGFGNPLLRARPDGTRVTQLTDLPGFFSDWSADGKRIAFDFFEPDGNEQIATMAADGSDLRVITSGPGIHEVPSWSPNGRRIVFGFSPELFDPEQSGGLRDPPLDDARERQQGQAAAHGPPGFDVEPDMRRTAAGSRSRACGSRAAATRRRYSSFARRVAASTSSPRGERTSSTPPGRRTAAGSRSTHPEGTIEAIRPDGSERRTILQATEGFGGHKPWFSPDGAHPASCARTGGRSPSPARTSTTTSASWTPTAQTSSTSPTPSSTFENWPSWGPAPRRHHDDFDKRPSRHR